MGLHIDRQQEGYHQICSFRWADNYWILSHSKTHLAQMMMYLTEEAEEWDLEPKLASLWWTRTCASEEKKENTICTRTWRHRILFEKSFKILGYSCDQAGKTQDCLEERMQNANKAWWRDAKIYRGKDVPWRVKFRRMVELVHSEFCCGTETCFWSQATLDRIKGWRTKAMRRLFVSEKKMRRWWNTTQGRRGLQERFGQR